MLRRTSTHSEQGGAVITSEHNTDAGLRLVPENAQKTMRDAVIIGGKRAAIWVDDFSKSDMELDIRFASLSNSIVSGEHWTVHRLVCVPRDPEPNTDEWEMVRDFYKMMYQEASWAGTTTETFEAYLKGISL